MASYEDITDPSFRIPSLTEFCDFLSGRSTGVVYHMPEGHHSLWSLEAERQNAIATWKRTYSGNVPVCPYTGERVDVEAWGGRDYRLEVYFVCNHCRGKARAI